MILPQHDFITDILQSIVEIIGTKICSVPWRLLTFSTISSKWDPTVRATLKTVSRLWSLSWQHVRTGISSFFASSAMKKRLYLSMIASSKIEVWRFSLDSICKWYFKKIHHLMIFLWSKKVFLNFLVGSNTFFAPYNLWPKNPH